MKKLELGLPIYTFRIDFVGHVSDIVFIQWIDIGRLELLKAAGLPADQIAEQSIVPVLVSTEIVYKQPLLIGDRVRAEVWVSALRRASAPLEFRFYNDENVLCASGSQRGLFVHRQSMRPYRMPREFRAGFEPFLEGGPG